jgi:hypothetical protein
MSGEPDATEQKMFGRLAFPHQREHGRRGKRSGRAPGARGPRAVGSARRDHECAPHGDARPVNAGMASSPLGRPPHQTAARGVGAAWRDVRPLATSKAIGQTVGALPPSAGPRQEADRDGAVSGPWASGGSSSPCCGRPRRGHRLARRGVPPQPDPHPFRPVVRHHRSRSPVAPTAASRRQHGPRIGIVLRASGAERRRP